MYSPADVERITYPYLVTIYAFLISALISFVNSNLTRNDAIFVLVAVASPVTLYLWVMFLFGAVFVAIFRRASPWVPAHGNSQTQIFLYVSILGSLVIWATMLGIIVGSPSGAISFSQQACSRYGAHATTVLVWPMLYLFQLFLLYLGLIRGPNDTEPSKLDRISGSTKDKTVL